MSTQVGGGSTPSGGNQDPFGRVARDAAKLIIGRIDGVVDDSQRTTIKVDAELIVRGSTAPVGERS